MLGGREKRKPQDCIGRKEDCVAQVDTERGNTGSVSTDESRSRVLE